MSLRLNTREKTSPHCPKSRWRIGGRGENRGKGGGGKGVRGFPRQAVWRKRWEASEKGRGWGVGVGTGSNVGGVVEGGGGGVPEGTVSGV